MCHSRRRDGDDDNENEDGDVNSLHGRPFLSFFFEFFHLCILVAVAVVLMAPFRSAYNILCR